MKLLILFLLVSFTTAYTAQAQELQLSDNANITLITILPGDAPEELFGHSAVRVEDPENNIDISYNYGTFQFDAFFLPKFIYGDLEYFLSTARFPAFMHHYRQGERPMIEQVINLSNPQKQQLFEFLQANARPENRYYQYDFLYDNCSTRIRDAFEHVLGDDIRFAPDRNTGLTFRDMIHQYVDHRPFIHLGIDLLLGSTIDIPATTHQQMFLPDYLMHEFDLAEIRIDGEFHPLVAETEIILEIAGYDLDPTSFPWAILLTWVLFLIGSVVTYNALKSGRRIVPRLDVPLFVITGIIGVLITFLWFFSLHTETVNNMNLMWAWPMHLFLIPILYRRTDPGIAIAVYFGAAAVFGSILLLGWTFWAQELHPAIIPIVLLLILRCGVIGSSAIRTSPSENIT